MSKTKEITIDEKKIANILSSLNDAEYRYLSISMGFRDNLQRLIHKYNLTEETICKRFILNKNQYNKYISGAWNYTVSDMATLNSFYMELEIEELRKNPPIEVVK